MAEAACISSDPSNRDVPSDRRSASEHEEPLGQTRAEDLHAQKVDHEPVRATQSLNTEDIADLANSKPLPDAAKTDISAGIAEVLRPSAAAPLADRSVSPALVPRTRAQGGRGDAFDPSQNPTAPGAPRSLGTIARAATANNLEAEYANGQ